jgi:hypothetical protein
MVSGNGLGKLLFIGLIFAYGVMRDTLNALNVG